MQQNLNTKASELSLIDAKKSSSNSIAKLNQQKSLNVDSTTTLATNNNNNNKKSAFGKLSVQRRKTIHDTINLDEIKSYIKTSNALANKEVDYNYQRATEDDNLLQKKSQLANNVRSSPAVNLNMSCDQLNSLKAQDANRPKLQHQRAITQSPMLTQMRSPSQSDANGSAHAQNPMPVLNRELIKQGHVTLFNVKKFFLIFKK